MRALPSGILKILCSQRILSLMSNPVGASSLRTNSKVANTIFEKLCPFEASEAISLIRKHALPIPWEQVTKALAEDNEDVKKVILKSCSELRDADIMMSFYKYVIDKGENFSHINLFMIVKTLSFCPPEKILEHEELLIYLFNECKDFMMDSQIFRPYAMRVFSYIPSCHKELLPVANKLKPRIELDHLKRELICRAFDFDDASTAWQLLEELNHLLIGGILESFTNYCIRQALQNKFSIDLIHSLVNLCNRRGLIIYSSDIICSLQPLVNVLMHCQDEYVWSIRKCTVNDQMECLNCNTTLNEVKLGEGEFKTLKNTVFETLIPKKDVFLKTSQTELSSFKHFLNTCKPYDMVVDGLNLLYRGVQNPKKKMILQAFSNYINQKQRKVLIITRQHSQKEKLFKSFPNAKIFHTDNSSDDDVFLLYAAMHGGLGTDILTSDFLCTHTAKLHTEMKTLFIKWQHYHQYIADPELGIILPSRHLGLPQCTESPETGGDSYKWHLSYQEKNTSFYSFRLKFDWVCLQAIPKKRVEKKISKIYEKPLSKNFKSFDSYHIKATK